MHIPAETLQDLINRQVAKDRQAEQFYEYQRRGDMESAHFVQLKPEQQATLYAREAIADAVTSARHGDAAGTQRGIQTAIDQTLYQGAQLANPRQQRPLPRRKRGR
jgi:hypothetical protein